MKNKNESYLSYVIIKLKNYWEDKTARYVIMVGGVFFVIFCLILVFSLTLSSKDNRPYLTKKSVFLLIEEYCNSNVKWYYKNYPSLIKFKIDNNDIEFVNNEWKLTLLPINGGVSPIINLKLYWKQDYNYNDIDKELIKKDYSHFQSAFEEYNQSAFKTGDFDDKKYQYNLNWDGQNNTNIKFLISKQNILNNVDFSNFIITKLSFNPNISKVNAVSALTPFEINIHLIKTFPTIFHFANAEDISKYVLVFRVIDNDLSILYNNATIGYTFVGLLKTLDNKLIIYIWNNNKYKLNLADSKINFQFNIQLIT